MNSELNVRFDEVYLLHRSTVLGYLTKRIKNFEDAEDLTEDIFLSLYKYLPCFDESRSPIAAYLFVIVKSRLKNYYRDRKITVSYDDAFDSGKTDETGTDFAERAISLMETRCTVSILLRRLSERERDVVVLKYFGNFSTQEIAEKCGLSAGNVRVITTRALSKMRKLLRVSEESLEEVR